MEWSKMDTGLSEIVSEIRYSLAGQDTRPSPERPGFESRWRKLFIFVFCAVWLPMTLSMPLWSRGFEMQKSKCTCVFGYLCWWLFSDALIQKCLLKLIIPSCSCIGCVHGECKNKRLQTCVWLLSALSMYWLFLLSSLYVNANCESH